MLNTTTRIVPVGWGGGGISSRDSTWETAGEIKGNKKTEGNRKEWLNFIITPGGGGYSDLVWTGVCSLSLRTHAYPFLGVIFAKKRYPS